MWVTLSHGCLVTRTLKPASRVVGFSNHRNTQKGRSQGDMETKENDFFFFFHLLKLKAGRIFVCVDLGSKLLVHIIWRINS
jgi:hypothetical protein